MQEHDGVAASGEATVITHVPGAANDLGALPGHRVEGLIARGGMGAIYRARQQALEREVAVKVMTRHADSPEMAERFRREALVLGRLAHPNIVPVYDIGADDEGQLFYTMKLVKGRTLQAILHDLSSDDADTKQQHSLVSLLTVFRKVCDAMAFAHSQGVLHRDLKPDNIMVGEFGEVLVMDWGLAKMLHSEQKANSASEHSSFDIPASSFSGTLAGSVMGTPQYMSPEQAMGQIDELDERSDIFSLGGILYAILTLRPPVEGKTLDEVLEKVRTGSIISPTEMQAGTTAKKARQRKGDVLEAKLIRPLPHAPNGRVPAALSAVVMKALRLEKARRYQNVAALSTDIESYQGGFATSAEQAGALRQITLLMLRHKMVTGALAALLVISSVFVVKVMASEQAARASESIAVQREGETRQALARSAISEQAARSSEALAVQREGETRQALARSAMSLAEAALREGDGPATRRVLDEVPEDLRDPNWHFLHGQSDSSIAQLGKINCAFPHPRQPGVFAVVDYFKGFSLMDVHSRKTLRQFESSPGRAGWAFGYCIAVSPDGERIACTRRSQTKVVSHCIEVYQMKTGALVSEMETGITEKLAFSPDSRTLLSAEHIYKTPNRIHHWDVATGRKIWTHDIGQVVLEAVFTPDGRHILSLSRGVPPELINVSDGSLMSNPTQHAAHSCAISPDGALLVTGDDLGMIRGTDLKDGRVVFQARANVSKITNLAFTSDGLRLISISILKDGRQDIRLWDAQTGLPVQPLLGGQGDVHRITVHPLSGELLVGGADSRVWSLGGERRTLRRNASRSDLAFWGADDLLFAPGKKTGATLQRLRGDALMPVVVEPEVAYGFASISADGQTAAVGGSFGSTVLPVLRKTGEKIEQIATLDTFLSHTQPRLSPKGQYVALTIYRQEQIMVLNVATTKQLIFLENAYKHFADFAWLSDRHLLALATDKARRGLKDSVQKFVVWDVTTKQIVKDVVSSAVLDAIALAPGGRQFAAAGPDKKVHFYDAETLAHTREFRAHEGSITALAWHPTLPILVTGSEDLTLRFWDVNTGRRLAELRGPLASPHTLAFSPSGKLLGCASLDGATRLWELNLAALQNPDADASPTITVTEATPPADEAAPAVVKAETGKWEFLLGALQAEQVAQATKKWRLENGKLHSQGGPPGVLPLAQIAAGESYEIMARLSRKQVMHVLVISLPVGDRMVGFELEGLNGEDHYTGLNHVKGLRAPRLPGVIKGVQISDQAEHELVIHVQPSGTTATITSTLDGKPLYSWSGPMAELDIEPHWSPGPGMLGIGAFTDEWTVHSMRMRRTAKAQ